MCWWGVLDRTDGLYLYSTSLTGETESISEMMYCKRVPTVIKTDKIPEGGDLLSIVGIGRIL